MDTCSFLAYEELFCGGSAESSLLSVCTVKARLSPKLVDILEVVKPKEL